MEFLDEIVKQNKVEIDKIKDAGFKQKVDDQRGFVISSVPSIIQMDKKFFSYKREMKQLFANSANQFGALGLDEEDKRDNRNTVNDQIEAQMEGASKR